MQIDNEDTDNQPDEETVVIDLEDDDPAPTKTPAEEPAPEPEAASEPAAEAADSNTGGSDDDSGFDNLSEEERQKFGRRAQKRIKALISDRKGRDETIEDLQAQVEALTTAHSKHETDTRSNQQLLLEQSEERLIAQEAAAKDHYRTARESGDLEAEMTAQDALADAKAERMLLNRAKAQLAAAQASDAEDEGGEEAPAAETPQVAKPDKRALKWHSDNQWFGGNSPSERLMTATAAEIHVALIDEGIRPDIDEEEYYEELNSRVLKEFPDYFKEGEEDSSAGAPSRNRPQQTVAGGTRTSGTGRKSITLTKTQVATAKRIGVDPKVYAQEVAKLQKRQ